MQQNSMLKKYAKETGKMSSEQDKDLVAKKMRVACRARGAGSSDHISFRAESAFLKIPLRSLNTLSAARSAQNTPLVIC